MKEIFISHSTKDKFIVDKFIDLILNNGLSITPDKIFCTSADGMKIKSGDDWRKSIQKSLGDLKIILLIITPNYKESEICLNEMGAAWVLDSRVIPLIVDPINYKSVGILMEIKQCEKILDENSLDELKDIVQEELEINAEKIKSARWTTKKKEFISAVTQYLSANPFHNPLNRSEFDKMVLETQNLNNTIDELVKEKDSLEKFNKELKLLKDKASVEKIVKKYEKITDYQDFIELCGRVEYLLDNFAPIVRGIIFKEYSGKNIEIKIYDKSPIDYALAQDWIDDELNVDWQTTSLIAELRKNLNSIDKIIQSQTNDNFDKLFESEFEVPLKLDNLDFWETVFNTKITFE